MYGSHQWRSSLVTVILFTTLLLFILIYFTLILSEILSINITFYLNINFSNIVITIILHSAMSNSTVGMACIVKLQ